MSRPNPGYIYVKNWQVYQHPDAKRRAAPGMAWIKLYNRLLDDDRYLDLSPTYRAALHGIHMLVARTGQGRCSARADYLQRQLRLPAGFAQKSIDALVEAGWIEVRASKARVPGPQTASAEIEGSKEPQNKKRTRARSATRTTSSNGDQPHPPEAPPLTREQRRAEARRALELIHTQTVKEMP